MAFVDLHLHTTFSDGIVVPSELVKIAAENGTGVMSVTDHDNCSAFKTAEEEGKKFGVRVIVGAELSTTFHGKAIHLVALGFDPANQAIIHFLEKNLLARKNFVLSKIEAINQNCIKDGVEPIDIGGFVKYCGEFFGYGKAADYLVEKGLAADGDSARQLLALAKAVNSYGPPEEAIAAVHTAGGIAVLAHPFAPKISLKQISSDISDWKKYVAEMVLLGLDGIECRQSGHQKKDEILAFEIATDNRLLVSSGTDWHGPLEKLDVESFLSYIPNYAGKPGDLKVSTKEVAPLMERLGVVVDKK